MTKPEMKDKRIIEISFAKGIGIILVVLGHCLPDGYFKRLIYLFHMPLFFFISGYLFNYSNNIVKYIIRKIKSLYVPFVFCNLLALIFHNAFCNIGIYSYGILYTSIKDYIKQIIKTLLCIGSEEIVGPLWFLPCLMISSILFYTMVMIENKYKMSQYIRHICSLLIFLLAFLFVNLHGLLFSLYIKIATAINKTLAEYLKYLKAKAKAVIAKMAPKT